MADILMINVPFAGHTNPTLPLAALLVQRGHRVCHVNAEEFRGKIERTGADIAGKGNDFGRGDRSDRVRNRDF